MKRILLGLSITCIVWAQEPDQPPMLDLDAVPAGGAMRGLPIRGVDIRGIGDGSAHHFFYVVKSGPGMLLLQLQARAREGATTVKVRLQDEKGLDLSQVEALAGSQDSVLESSHYQCEEARTLHLHVNIDPNAGPYSLTVTGPLTK
ncbi:MAG: hypothetical protein KF760_34230 [Candidatus Eremiobacteraeota bacterium]|nr:hypothetical protein [Candidatus Eremiobacteraeota bacterium]MCW5872814.1 hypothetical protein [Candidatus Eremiobacteraeota bacterium]